jgi:hypothetical protein
VKEYRTRSLAAANAVVATRTLARTADNLPSFDPLIFIADAPHIASFRKELLSKWNLAFLVVLDMAPRTARDGVHCAVIWRGSQSAV